jgi:hypothetical protein
MAKLERKSWKRPARGHRAPVRLRTGTGTIRFVKGTIWLQRADLVHLRLQEFHRAAIGWTSGIQLTAASNAPLPTAKKVYHHAVTCYLGQFIACDDRERLQMFARLLEFVEASWSFDGLEFAFETGMHTARAAGRTELVRRGEILWRRIGPPRVTGGGLDAVPVYHSVRNTLRFTAVRGQAPRIIGSAIGRGGASPSFKTAAGAEKSGKSGKSDNGSSGSGKSSSAEGEESNEQAAHQRHLEWAAKIVGAAGAFAASKGYGLAVALVKGTWLEPDQRVSANEFVQREHDRKVDAAVEALGTLVAQIVLAPLAVQIVEQLEAAGILDKIDQLVEIGEQLKNEFTGAADDIKGMMLDRFEEGLRGLEGALNEFVTGMADFYGSEFDTAMNNARDAIGGLANGLNEFGDDALAAAGEFFGAVGDAAGCAFGAIADGASDGIGFIMSALGMGDEDSNAGNETAPAGETSGSPETAPAPADEQEEQPAESDEPDPGEVDPETPPKPPDGDGGYPNPNDDDPYTGGGANPYAADVCPVGMGLLSLLTYSDGEFGCGNVPKLGPGGLRLAQLGYLNLVAALREEFEDQRSHHTDPLPTGDDSTSGGPINPARVNPGFIDPSPELREAAIRLVIRALLRP